MNVEGRERFFRAIAERIDVERVEEVHVFPPIRQGGRESGVAVLTLRPLPPESEGAEEIEEADESTGVAELEETENSAGIPDGEEIEDSASISEVEEVEGSASAAEIEELGNTEDVGGTEDIGDTEAIGGTEAVGDTEDTGDIAGTEEIDDIAAVIETEDGESLVDIEAADVFEDVEDVLDAALEPVQSPPPPQPPRRFTVLRANYRLQLKGPDRGKWEVGVVEEADAPAATVDEVVRGVHERAGGWSVEGPERLTGDEFRAALVEEPWSATR